MPTGGAYYSHVATVLVPVAMAQNARSSAQEKHAYSMHQDSLLWSRIQVLIAIQTGTLTGTFYFGQQDDILYAAMLSGLGLVLTVLLWILAERDQLHREKSLVESGVKATTIAPEFPLSIRGADIIRIVIVLLAYSDAVVLLLPFAERSLLVSILPVLAITFGMVAFSIKARADRELARIRNPPGRG